MDSASSGMVLVMVYGSGAISDVLLCELHGCAVCKVVVGQLPGSAVFKAVLGNVPGSTSTALLNDLPPNPKPSSFAVRAAARALV